MKCRRSLILGVIAMVLLVPLEVAANISSIPLFWCHGQDAIRNAGFEDWTDDLPDCWSYGYGDDWDKSWIELEGIHSARGTQSGGAQVYLYQYLPESAREAIAGHTVEFGFWFKTSDEKTYARANLGYTYSDWIEPSTDSNYPWKYVSVKKYFSSQPSSVIIKIYGDNRVDSDQTRIYIDYTQLRIYDEESEECTYGAAAMNLRIKKVSDKQDDGVPSGKRMVRFEVSAAAASKTGYIVKDVTIKSYLGYYYHYCQQYGEVDYYDPIHTNDVEMHADPIGDAEDLHSWVIGAGLAASATIYFVGGMFGGILAKVGAAALDVAQLELLKMYEGALTNWDPHGEGPGYFQCWETTCTWDYSWYPQYPLLADSVTRCAASEWGEWVYNKDQYGQSNRWIKLEAIITWAEIELVIAPFGGSYYYQKVVGTTTLTTYIYA